MVHHLQELKKKKLANQVAQQSLVKATNTNVIQWPVHEEYYSILGFGNACTEDSSTAAKKG